MFILSVGIDIYTDFYFLILIFINIITGKCNKSIGWFPNCT